MRTDTAVGTGTGVGTSWLLEGMDANARLVSVERNADVQAIARKHLGEDPRVTFVTGDAGEFLGGEPAVSYDLVFADGGSGKIRGLDVAVGLLRPGAIYIGDDLRPHLLQEDERAQRVRTFEETITARDDLAVVKLDWSSGVVLATRRP